MIHQYLNWRHWVTFRQQFADPAYDGISVKKDSESKGAELMERLGT